MANKRLMTREQIILNLVKGKNVLDLGAANFDRFAFHRKAGTWLHELMAKEAKSILGVDIQAEVVADLVSAGFNFQVGNVEQMQLDRQFDVIVAGEIIEHLFNAGQFLESIRKHLKKDGICVITTPNAFSIRYTSLVYRFLLGNKPRARFDHTCWYCMQTLSQLLSFKDFVVIEKHYCTFPSHSSVRKYVRNFLYGFRKEWADTILFVCKLK
jgi:2-polyprenyl-3-methyl-5-hydroxy-6-metoxy-1,4-benzoquinol methylase